MPKATQLDAPQEEAYRTWLRKIGQTPGSGYNVDSAWTGTDYDYRGFFKKNGAVDVQRGQHFTDEFKLPNHPTFSVESVYATGDDLAKAGKWEGEKFVPPTKPMTADESPIAVRVPGFDKPVYFPRGMTPEQIQHAIETDVLPERKTAAVPVEAPYQTRPEGLARAGRGAQDTLDRVSQLIMNAGEKLGLLQPGLTDIATEQMNAEQAKYEKDLDLGSAPAMRYDRGSSGPAAGGDKYGRKQIDLPRLLGNAGMQSPLALLPAGTGILGRAKMGAIQGGASGALQYDPSNTLAAALKNVAMGGTAGAVLAPVAGAASDKSGDLVERLFGRARGMVSRATGEASEQAIKKAVPELQQLPAELQRDLVKEAQAQISKTGKLSAEQLSRKANLLANDVTPTKSMVTRDPADWTLERNLQKLSQSPDEQLSGVGRQLTDVYQSNDTALAGKLYGLNPSKATQEGYGMTVMKSLDDLADASQKDVGKIYDQIRVAKGGDLASDAKMLSATLDDLKDSTYAEKMVSSVTNKLKRFGMIDKEGALTTQTLTLDQAEELRKFVNKLPNDFGKRDIIKAIDADVMAGAGEDAFGAARAAASERFGMLENPATQKAINAYGELTQGKTAQNFIKSQVVDASAQDVKTLVETLGKIPDATKKAEALDAMKGGVMSYLQSKAINANSNQFSGAALNKAMREIGEDKLQLVLGGDYAKLKSLAQAGLDSTYQPAYAAVNHSNTAPMLMSLAQKARAFPGVPLVVNENVEKLAARVGYEKQLADALAAQSRGELPKLPARAKQIGEVLQKLGIPASQAGLDQLRKDPDKKAQKRK